jgi:transketolase
MKNLSMREGYGRALADYGAVNPDVVVLDVDTASSTLSGFFEQRFPERFYNIGIAEPCMVDVGVGLALGGYIPFVNAFSALLALRSLEAIRSNVCYARTNVKIAAGYAGLSDYKDGPTHHSITDIAILRSLPGMTLIVPSDGAQSGAFVPLMADWDGPVTLRLNRCEAIPVFNPTHPLEIGKGIQHREGNDLAIIACGAMVGRSLLAAERLLEKGINARVVEIHTLKPLDVNLVCQAAAETGAVITAEEHTIIGGLGSAVAETLAEHCPTKTRRIGISDVFTRTAPSPASLMDAFGLGIDEIVKVGEELLGERSF